MGLRSLPTLLLQSLDLLVSVRPRVLRFGAGLTLTDSGDGTALLEASGGGGSFVGASAYMSAPQSIADNTGVNLSFDSEHFDTNAIHSGGSPTRMTIPTGKDGYWFVSGLTVFDVNATGERDIGLFKNGGAGAPNNWELWSGPALGGAGLKTEVPWSIIVGGLIGGDYLEINVYQDSGAPLDVIGSGPAWSRFQVQWLGA